MTFIVYLFVFFCLTVIYLEIAKIFQITDEPNIRSSHLAKTIRGAGITFPLGLIFPILFLHQFISYKWLVFALVLISMVSFIDDLKTLNSKWRIIVHFVAVSLLLVQTGLFSTDVPLLFLTFLSVVGIINVFNFMDGINGITAVYSLVTVCSLYYINKMVIPFIENDYFAPIAASLIAFGFFNVRKQARAFAGDAGSVSIAFIVCFLLIKLMIQTQSVFWILLLSIYGIDSVFTILFRIMRHENIFTAHRSHFYQYLANEVNIQHTAISCAYALIQLAINIIAVYSFVHHLMLLPLTILFIVIAGYLTFRFSSEGKNRLMIKYQKE